MCALERERKDGYPCSRFAACACSPSCHLCLACIISPIPSSPGLDVFLLGRGTASDNKGITPESVSPAILTQISLVIRNSAPLYQSRPLFKEALRFVFSCSRHTEQPCRATVFVRDYEANYIDGIALLPQYQCQWLN